MIKEAVRVKPMLKIQGSGDETLVDRITVKIPDIVIHVKAGLSTTCSTVHSSSLRGSATTMLGNRGVGSSFAKHGSCIKDLGSALGGGLLQASLNSFSRVQ